MCEDIDAYEMNSTYRSNLESHIMMMRGSLRKSFGAREGDEGKWNFDPSGDGRMLPRWWSVFRNKMKGPSFTPSELRCAPTWKTGKPILAVKSELYFGFQIRRVRELQNIQIHFFQV